MIPLPYGKIALIAAIFAAGAAGGWAVQGWRMGDAAGELKAEVSRLQARVAILEPANEQCAKSVAAANKAAKGLIAAGLAREQKAQEAVKAARSEAAGLATSIAILRAMPKPAVAPDALCEAGRKLLSDEVASRAK